MTLVMFVQVTVSFQQRYTFNVAVSKLMTLSNTLRDHKELRGSLEYHCALEAMCLLLAPMAPHITSQLWEGLPLLVPHNAAVFSVHSLSYVSVFLCHSCSCAVLSTCICPPDLQGAREMLRLPQVKVFDTLSYLCVCVCE